jgi:hypothetical protein
MYAYLKMLFFCIKSIDIEILYAYQNSSMPNVHCASFGGSPFLKDDVLTFLPLKRHILILRKTAIFIQSVHGFF